MAAGLLVCVSGLVLWCELQRQLGERALTPIATDIYRTSALLWLGAIALRVTVQDWAAAETVAAQAPPRAYPAAHALMAVLHGGHMVLAYSSAAVLGAGVVRSHVLPAVLGWIGLLGGAASAVGFVLAGRRFLGALGAPFFALVYPFALGVVLLRVEVAR
jgi:hypothetical protein